MKELFWIGDKNRNVFKTKQELQVALSDIRSIGWDISDYFYFNLSFEHQESLYHGAYGAIKKKDKNGNVIEYKINAFYVMPDRLLDNLENPDCGIYVYEIKPNPDSIETIPIGTKSYYANPYKYGSFIEINGNSYFMSPSRYDLFKTIYNNNNLVKEGFWIGNIDNCGFKTLDELTNAIYNIKSIGWDIADTDNPLFKIQGWNAYGIVKTKNKKKKQILGKIKKLKDSENSIDVIYALHPDCGIYVYEVKPIKYLTETIPLNLTVLTTSTDSFSSTIEINNCQYRILSSFPSEPKEDIIIPKDHCTNIDNFVEDKSKDIFKKDVTNITSEINNLKNSIDECISNIKYLYYIIISLIIIIILYVVLTRYKFKQLIKSKTHL